MSLTVLTVCYAMAPVSSDAVGGAEQIASQLDHALVVAGHNSVVATCEGSRASGKQFTFPLPPAALMRDDQSQYREQMQTTIGRDLRANQLDLIRVHGLDQLPSAACQEPARRCFSSDRVIDLYLRLYRSVVTVERAEATCLVA